MFITLVILTGPRGLMVNELRLRCPPSRVRAPATADLTSLLLGRWTPYEEKVENVAAQIPELPKKKKKLS